MRIALGTLVLALVAAEIAARVKLGPAFVAGAWVGPPQQVCGAFDPDLGWVNRPGSSSRIANEYLDYRVEINAAGLRDDDHPYAKKDGLLRICLLGDSTSWGWGVEEDESFAFLVEHAFADLEVVNLAVPGYSTDQELFVLETEGAKYAPDIVLLGFVLNDVTGNLFPEMHGMKKPHWVRGEDGEWTLVGRPVPEPEAGQLAGKLALRKLSRHLALVKMQLPPPPEHRRVPLERPEVQAKIAEYWGHLVDPDRPTHMLLERLRRACDAMDAELWAFVVPHLHDRYLYEPATPPPPGTGEGDFRTLGSQRLAEAAGLIGFRALSVDQALLDVVRTGVSLDCGDEHLNARGNAVVAEVLLAHLRPWVAARRAAGD